MASTSRLRSRVDSGPSRVHTPHAVEVMKSWNSAAAGSSSDVTASTYSSPSTARRFAYACCESRRRPSMRDAQTAGSTTTSILAAPLSGTNGWRHTSTGNDTFTSE